MNERRVFAHVPADDLDRLRDSFEAGAEWTKDEAARILDIPERRFRACVSELREQGVPIVSTSERGSVYRMARTRDEAIDFVDRELMSRIHDIERQVRAIHQGMDKHFPTTQLPLAFVPTANSQTKEGTNWLGETKSAAS